VCHVEKAHAEKNKVMAVVVAKTRLGLKDAARFLHDGSRVSPLHLHS
jgi:hypothetical protein